MEVDCRLQKVATILNFVYIRVKRHGPKHLFLIKIEILKYCYLNIYICINLLKESEYLGEFLC